MLRKLTIANMNGSAAHSSPALPCLQAASSGRCEYHAKYSQCELILQLPCELV